MYVQLGEPSSGRQALEGAELAPGNNVILRELNKRPARPLEPIPNLPAVPLFNLDEKLFCRSLRSAKRGAAGGPSGMRSDHLRPLLQSSRDSHSLYAVGALLARGQIPPPPPPPSTTHHHPPPPPPHDDRSDQGGRNDSFAEKRRRGPRYCCRRGGAEVGGQNDCPAVGPSSGGSNCSVSTCPQPKLDASACAMLCKPSVSSTLRPR